MKRHTYVSLVLLVMGLGYLSRRIFAPGTMGYEDAGDLLWAIMVSLGVGALAGSGRLKLRTLCALFVCLAVESSQALHAPRFAWLDALRATRAGGLFLGHGFSLHDMGLYALGCGLSATLEALWRTRALRTSRAL
jgi:Protein of unknown function (DUF2809)